MRQHEAVHHASDARVGDHGAEPLTPGESIRVRGVVQGVGFRPTVWRLAKKLGLRGNVCNDTEGVLIRVAGEQQAREQFVRCLQSDAPPLARVDAVERTLLADNVPLQDEFVIAASRRGEVHTAIAADAATCDACRQDVADAGNRRHAYAFTNCTHCGPRLSIVYAVPYDRECTSMQRFPQCARCQAEYDDPADRRFHAQPNACPDCGPALWLEHPDGRTERQAPIDAARAILRRGGIVAVKGIGGFHLACDAGNATAVKCLRQRKYRLQKPFALLAPNIDVVRRYCSVNDSEAQLLSGPVAPIVLLAANGERELPNDVAPGQRQYGFMLPYSPLHVLLLDGYDEPLVFTSGNRSDEPQCIDNAAARQQLAGIADALLLHDRDIVNRVDDSVLRQIAGRPSMLRRARGYAPQAIRLPAGFQAAPPLLACGGELKSTFCLLRDGEAILSQHLGDLENAAAHAAYLASLSLYESLFQHQADAIAIDCHPDYLSSKFGRERAAVEHRPLIEVQHHHAHIAACLAENGVAIDAPPVLGIALDGSGYGDGGQLWGGELLLADYRGYRRLASLAPVAMPGGAQAIRQPWRMGMAHLQRVFAGDSYLRDLAELPFVRSLDATSARTVSRMIEQDFNSPLSSSCGRLFDAVAAVIAVCDAASYEGQAAIELEAAVDESALADGMAYPFALETSASPAILDPVPMWRALLQDLDRGAEPGVIAARFHAGLALALAQTVTQLTRLHDDPWQGRVALSGGVFQNAVLTSLLLEHLEAGGYEVLRHGRLPANDGGLSLGQATVAAARLLAANATTEAAVCA